MCNGNVYGLNGEGTLTSLCDRTQDVDIVFYQDHSIMIKYFFKPLRVLTLFKKLYDFDGMLV